MHSDINEPALPETVPDNHLSGSPLMLRSSPTVVFRNHGSGLISLPSFCSVFLKSPEHLHERCGRELDPPHSPN